MHQANTSAWVLEEFVKAGGVYPDNHPLVKHAPKLFDRLIEDPAPKKSSTVRKAPAR